MTTHNILKYGRWLLGLYLIIFTITMTSCTQDYFEDENNFRLYVPQIEKGEIESFYIAIHNAAGSHIISREIAAPFDKDDLMKQGILRFKVPYGENYHISCFANYDTDAVKKGDNYTDSYLQKPAVAGKENTYSSKNTDTRAYLATASVYPIGHPQASIPRVVNIDDNQRIKGRVTIKFQDLPSNLNIARIDTYYKGLAARYAFAGHFTQATPQDRILFSIDAAEYTNGSNITFSNLYSSSSGVVFGSMPALEPLTRTPAIMPTGEPVELEIHLFNAAGAGMGVISFTDADFQQLKETDPTKVPKDGDGNPVEHLVLEPQKTITFTLKDFTVISIEIVSWGDIIDGESTPM